MEINQGTKRKVTIDIVKANVFAIILLALSAIMLLIPFFFIWKGENNSGVLASSTGWAIFFISFFIGIVVHELIHGLTWSFYAKSGWRSIRFGVMWKYLTPYCHCTEPMHIRGYIMGGIMPCIILGIIPSVIALVIGSLPLLAWGIIFIASAAGDIWIVWLLTKEKPGSMVMDHPSEAGFYIIDKEDSKEERE